MVIDLVEMDLGGRIVLVAKNHCLGRDLEV